MSLKEHRKKSPQSVKVIVVTVSDSRTKETDVTGKYIAETLKKESHEIVDHVIMENNSQSIEAFIAREMVWYRAQVLIFNGGTGISSKDITVNAVEKMIDKKLDGFGELFRALSYKEIGSAAILSRAMAGVAGSTLIICLPGSPKASELALEKLILPEIGHMVFEVLK